MVQWVWEWVLCRCMAVAVLVGGRASDSPRFKKKPIQSCPNLANKFEFVKSHDTRALRGYQPNLAYSGRIWASNSIPRIPPEALVGWVWGGAM